MTMPAASHFDALRFDPDAGEVIREPLDTGYGYWVGGHKVTWDEQDGVFVLFYRERTPLEKGRGGRCAVAVSTDGVHFEDVWTANKDDFAASSIEVGHVVRDPASGEWRLYISYELASGRFWRIDVVRGPSLDALDTQGRRTVLMPFDYGVRSLKDPWVLFRDGAYHLFLAGPAPRERREISNTLQARSYEATLLARSADGLYFPELEYVMTAPNTDTWHGRRARLNGAMPHDNGWLGFYDGGRTSFDMYEEWCGLAWSADGIHFDRLEQAEPWVRSPAGCVRYVYPVETQDAWWFYYEYTRPDLSHDLRVSRVSKP